MGVLGTHLSPQPGSGKGQQASAAAGRDRLVDQDGSISAPGGPPLALLTEESEDSEAIQSLLERLESEGSLITAARWQRAFKRLVDVLGALIGLLIFSPVYLGIAVAILLTSGSPIFYRHPRIGRDGTPFNFLKFRTMTSGADEERHLIIDLNEADGPVFKIRNDPRVTPLGRVLRHYSLDELPQLLHVLMGTMSLVGPRPPLPDEVQTYTIREWQRLRVKPGLTCIWQVSGRSDLGFRSWVDLDIEYILNWTLRSDLRLMVKTIPAIVTARGAY